MDAFIHRFLDWRLGVWLSYSYSCMQTFIMLYPYDVSLKILVLRLSRIRVDSTSTPGRTVPGKPYHMTFT
jgi:hypothetical protein